VVEAAIVVAVAATVVIAGVLVASPQAANRPVNIMRELSRIVGLLPLLKMGFMFIGIVIIDPLSGHA
jgi:hypothetical protein